MSKTLSRFISRLWLYYAKMSHLTSVMCNITAHQAKIAGLFCTQTQRESSIFLVNYSGGFVFIIQVK